jgi:rRNA-processing protein FCF1
MDADCLIKLTKAGLKEPVCRSFEVSVPQLVKREIVENGSGHADAGIIAGNIAQKLIKVRVDRQQYLKGEDAVLIAFKNDKYDAVCSDDRKFLKILRAASVPHATPAVLLCLLVRQKAISLTEACKHLEKLRAYISGDEYAVARLKLESF